MNASRPSQPSPLRRTPPQPGTPPGVLVPRPEASATKIVVRRFSADTYSEQEVVSSTNLASLLEPSSYLWVEVTGLADLPAIRDLGTGFALHDLSLEDALDPDQRGKVEHYENYTFVVLRSLVMKDEIGSNQLSIFLGDRFAITLQDVSHPAVDAIAERLRSGRGRVRDRGTDYLVYSLIDSIIDHYFPVVERFDDQLESIEDVLLEEQGVNPVDLARRPRRSLQTIRHAVWPTREVVTALMNEDSSRMTAETRIHLRDCYDHVAQLQEMLESSREIAASLLESYISRVSLRTNEVMQVLTIISTIFIPLTFITGLYGMNFNRQSSPLNMPELDWYWGYPFSLFLMVASVAGSLLYFRGKGWFGRR